MFMAALVFLHNSGSWICGVGSAQDIPAQLERKHPRPRSRAVLPGSAVNNPNRQ